jgi:hypothetical protein
VADRPTDGPDSGGEVDRQALLTVLTTEHFALQGARGSTISESSARAGLYVGAVSSGLVALGFIGRGATSGTTFDVFAIVVLPTLYLVGIFTFARLVESSIEDILYGRAINRIRQHYLEIAGPESRYLMLGAHDDTLGVLANMGVVRPTRWQLAFTLASMVSMLNAVVGGSAVAFVASVCGAPLAAAAPIGAAAGVASAAVHHRWQRGRHDDAREGREALSPSPEAA